MIATSVALRRQIPGDVTPPLHCVRGASGLGRRVPRQETWTHTSAGTARQETWTHTSAGTAQHRKLGHTHLPERRSERPAALSLTHAGSAPRRRFGNEAAVSRCVRSQGRGWNAGSADQGLKVCVQVSPRVQVSPSRRRCAPLSLVVGSWETPRHFDPDSSPPAPVMDRGVVLRRGAPVVCPKRLRLSMPAAVCRIVAPEVCRPAENKTERRGRP